MLELLPSPLTGFAIWLGFGALKTVIDIIKKTPVSFFDIAHSLVFGPIALASEVIQSFASNEPLEIDRKLTKEEESIVETLNQPIRLFQEEFDLNFANTESRPVRRSDEEEQVSLHAESLR